MPLAAGLVGPAPKVWRQGRAPRGRASVDCSRTKRRFHGKRGPARARRAAVSSRPTLSSGWNSGGVAPGRGSSRSKPSFCLVEINVVNERLGPPSRGNSCRGAAEASAQNIKQRSAARSPARAGELVVNVSRPERGREQDSAGPRPLRDAYARATRFASELAICSSVRTRREIQKRLPTCGPGESAQYHPHSWQTGLPAD